MADISASDRDRNINRTAPGRHTDRNGHGRIPGGNLYGNLRNRRLHPGRCCASSIIAVAYTILTGADVETGLALAMPIGTLMGSANEMWKPALGGPGSLLGAPGPEAAA